MGAASSPDHDNLMRRFLYGSSELAYEINEYSSKYSSPFAVWGFSVGINWYIVLFDKLIVVSNTHFVIVRVLCSIKMQDRLQELNSQDAETKQENEKLQKVWIQITRIVQNSLI